MKTRGSFPAGLSRCTTLGHCRNWSTSLSTGPHCLKIRAGRKSLLYLQTVNFREGDKPESVCYFSIDSVQTTTSALRGAVIFKGECGVHDSTQHQYRFDISEFEHWSRLAKVDPGAFEDRRTRIIEAYICSVPKERQARLRGLQWRIDQARRSAGTPLAACIRISKMMWDAVLGEHGLHATLNGVLDHRAPAAVAAPAFEAKILPFPDRRQGR